MNRRINLKPMLLLLLFCVLAAIFYFSSKDAAASSSQSRGLTRSVVMSVEQLTHTEHTEGERMLIERCLNRHIRKVAHFTEFLLLGVVLSWAVFSLRLKSWSPWSIVITASLACAVIDEYHQLFVSGRHGSIMDVCIDVFGALTGMWIYRKIRKSIQSRKKMGRIDAE